MTGIEVGPGGEPGSNADAADGAGGVDGERASGDDEFDRIEVSMVVSEIESIREVLECLDGVDATVRPETLSVEAPTRSAIELDVRRITPKQWEALRLAFDRGYYARPREVGLEQIAEELSISKSAVSQRLRAAEATLVASVFEAVRPSAVDGGNDDE
ncbi:helix-turn-helix domain-containing protein [Natrialbaceae archaeon GCM10025810]|uniref:helix-turn-helix domain-containing protein n=1 Tax=Halovalidus salilacus TaxID=3075124 RepID=UPI00360AD427